MLQLFKKHWKPDPNIEYSGTKAVKISGVNLNKLTLRDIGRFRGKAVREPDNPHDANAVVIIRDDGKILGHVAAHRAEKISAKLAKYGGERPCAGEIFQEQEYNSNRKFFMGLVEILWPGTE